MIEQALRYELVTHVPELSGSIYPTNAPEESEGPYLVYARITTRKFKTLQGYTDKQALSYMFSVMAKRYGDMIDIRDQVEAMLLTFPQTNIGEGDNIYVEDLDINNIDEQYEHALRVNRGIIDFTIYF